MKKTTRTIVMAALCLNLNVQAQSPNAPSQPKKQAISGKVISVSTGEALPGAVIKVTSTNQTILSNDTGEFILSLPNGSYNLSVHYLSYKVKSVNIQIPLKEQLIIALDTDDNNLKEVEINAGYYTVKDKERTGSISRVTAETIAQQPVSNVLGALIGRMAGVNIEQQSGVNGGGFKVEIRGVNSLRTDGRQPLYLIDGVPYPASPLTNLNFGVGGLSATSSPLNYISAGDIESIEVLKDADATAIYGSRGANGVILIRTKAAKTEKTSIDVNLSAGISKVGTKLDLLNTQEYLEMRNEAFKNDGITPGATVYDVNGTWDKERYTDWQKVLIGGTARTTNFQAAVTGGNQSTQFAFRGNYNKQTTVSPGDFADQKVSGALTVHHVSANSKFKANFSANYALNRNNLPRFDLTQYVNLPPNAPPVYDANGEINWALNSSGGATWDNPIASTRNEYVGKTNTFTSSGLLNYELLPGLFLRSSLGYTNIRLRENLLQPIAAKVPLSTARGISQITFNTIETWIVEPRLNYKRQLDKGTLDVLLGTTFQQDDQRRETLTGTGYTSDLLLENITSAPTRNASSSSSQYKYNALFGRINYNYSGKYLINITGRRDGSSRFAIGKQFANFGALGLVWVFSEESIFKNIASGLSFGKLRGSYGITGSDQIPDYGYLDTYTAIEPYKNGTALIPSRLANPEYSWETNRKLEFALDLGFLQDKIRFSAGWYRNLSSNQLVGYTLPDITGFPGVQYNLPASVQNTGWEFELNTINYATKSFSWKSSFNLTIPKNKLLAYPNIEGSTYVNTYTVGESLYTPRSYHYMGVNPLTGLYEFEDINKSGTTDAADRRAAHKPLTSHLYGGLQNSLTFKQFSLDVFFQFASKTVKHPLFWFSAPGTVGNQPVEVLQRWQKSNDETAIQKFSQSSIAGGATQRFGYLFNSDRFTDASFIRLKNVSIFWNAPAILLKRIKLNNLRLYIQAQNLFTLTGYMGDPEVVDLKALPGLTTVISGIQIGL